MSMPVPIRFERNHGTKSIAIMNESWLKSVLKVTEKIWTDLWFERLTNSSRLGLERSANCCISLSGLIYYEFKSISRVDSKSPTETCEFSKWPRNICWISVSSAKYFFAKTSCKQLRHWNRDTDVDDLILFAINGDTITGVW